MTDALVVLNEPATESVDPTPPTRLLRTTVLLLFVGCAVICWGFARSRSGQGGAIEAYFIGEFILVLSPIVFLGSNKTVTEASGQLIAFVVGVATYLVAFCYSPNLFPFTDEYQHAYTAQTILATNHLFHANPALQVSAQYPGLEIVTTEISRLAGLSLFASGSIIAAVSHVTLTFLMFVLAREFGLRPRAALFAVVLLSTGYDYQSFLSYFAYETITVVFLLAAMIFFHRLLIAERSRSRWLYALGTLSFAFLTVMSHHVTGLFLLAILSIWAVFAFQSPGAIGRRLLPLGLAGAVLLMLIAWNLRIATDTVHYLTQIPTLLLGPNYRISVLAPSPSVEAYVTAGHVHATATLALPLVVLGYLGIALLAGVIALGAITIGKDQEHYPRYIWAPLILSCVAYFALVPIELFAPGGIGLVGRGQMLLLIPAGIVGAIALDRAVWPLSILDRDQRTVAPSRTSTLVGALIVLGGVAASYPPYVGKLPAPFNISAYSRTTDGRTVGVGLWIARTLRGRPVVAAGAQEQTLIESIAGSRGTSDISGLFESDRFNGFDANLVQVLRIQYVVADHRLTTQVPANGANFRHDPLANRYSHPLPPTVLSKFASIPGVSRVFDDGIIVVYDLHNSQYYAKRSRGGR